MEISKTPSQPTVLRGVIFDLDGTLVDSNPQHAEAFKKAFEKFGFKFPIQKIRELIGMGADKLIPYLLSKEQCEAHAKDIGELKGDIFQKEYLHTITPFPKTRDLLLQLRAQGLAIAVASSASETEMNALIKIAGIEDVIDAVAYCYDGIKSKPDPDVIFLAMRKLSLDPQELLMVGDTPYDIAAAERAGIETIAFRSGNWDDAGLEKAKAIFDGPWELAEHLEVITDYSKAA